ncbi:hypothetical protein JCGZ_12422 [Jatropha curcas]|uniref:Uncharacterized protein n=1 Tax=Jatropha curcas TaxID=180498 RepID=A0A067K6T9_JATCU|nr:hypothetical protein JCGZ_12422 [Jatropha curcas]
MASFHLRANSLPSTSHPLSGRIEEQLYKLKTSHSSSIALKLACLNELYECVGDFLQLPHTQQTLSREHQKQYVEEALNESLGLLDICSVTRDFLLQMRERVQGLESSVRRTRGGESCLNEIDTYMVSRKKLTKVICKYLRNLKRSEKNCRKTTLADYSDSVITTLKGAEEISLTVFESILYFTMQSKAKSKPSGWSIVTKLLQSKHLSCKDEVEANEMEMMDAELLVLKSSKNINQLQNVLKGLEAMESNLQEAGEELECVYRKLVKTRVSLLNILNH